MPAFLLAAASYHSSTKPLCKSGSPVTMTTPLRSLAYHYPALWKSFVPAQAAGSVTHARRLLRHLSEPGQRPVRLRDLPQRAPVRRDGGAARFRVDLVGRASLHRLHDVPRRVAIPHLHGRADQAREARHDGGRAAVARPDAGGGKGLHAGQHLRREGHPRHRGAGSAGWSSKVSGWT